MMEKTMDELISMFKRAEEVDAKYVAVVIKMKGFKRNEVIINHIDNMRDKLEYYKKTYDEELNHKYASGIKIEFFWFANTFAELEEQLKYFI